MANKYPDTWDSTQLELGKSLTHEYASEVEPYNRAISSVACFFSGVVVFTAYLFYEDLVKDKIYMKLIVMISFCDLISSGSMIFGYLKSENACAIQGFISVFFFRATWFWTTVASIMIHLQIKYGKLPKWMSFKYMNIFTWGASIILQIVPWLFDSGYGGCFDGLSTGHIRWIGLLQVPDHIISNYFWLMMALIICTVVPVRLLLVTLPGKWSRGDACTYRILSKLVTHMVWYPAALLLFWGPPTIYSIYYSTHSGDNTGYNNQLPHEYARNTQYFLICSAWSCCYGVACSLIVFSKCNEARSRLYSWMKNGGKNIHTRSSVINIHPRVANLSLNSSTNTPSIPPEIGNSTDVSVPLNLNFDDQDFLEDDDYEFEENTELSPSASSTYTENSAIQSTTFNSKLNAIQKETPMNHPISESSATISVGSAQQSRYDNLNPL
jgi:hypothetical protein